MTVTPKAKLDSQIQNIYYIKNRGGTCDVMIIIIGNKHGDQSLNLGWNVFHIVLINSRKSMHPIIHLQALGKKKARLDSLTMLWGEKKTKFNSKKKKKKKSKNLKN